ncbi:MAG: hypothetical protein WAL40_15005, partial [Rhodoplanes sp.]
TTRARRTLMSHKDKAVHRSPGAADPESKHKPKRESEKRRKHEDEELDEALEESFPASDPVSISQP